MRIESGSFRDNSGFVFYDKGEIFRAVSLNYKENYDLLNSSKLYDKLVNDNYIIPHSEIEKNDLPAGVYKIIKPERIDFISYPYEWCFSQLKDAALTTLKIHKIALDHNMVLKDGSVYNIQFHKGKPLFIDTLSFEVYKENEPWIAYNQFCRNFLAPLALASLCDERLLQLFKDFIDGIPLETAANILREKSFLNLGLITHLHLHSYFQNKYSSSNKKVEVNKKWVNKNSQLRLIENLERTIEGLKLKRKKTNWSSYYSEHHSEKYYNDKRKIVEQYLNEARSLRVWDLGANEGEFSKLAAKLSNVTAFDSDHRCIENFYANIKSSNEKNILPLVMDFTNPSPSIGWANSERKSLTEWANADLVLALALIHHLAISNNVPLNFLAEYFNKLSHWLIIEFVPKNDPLVLKLLLNRKDIFDKYDIDNFEREFEKHFIKITSQKISGSERVLYLYKRKN